MLTCTPADRAAWSASRVVSAADGLKAGVMPVTWNHLAPANTFAQSIMPGLIFEMAGSSAVYRGRPIERAFRDINTAAAHTNYVDTAYAAIGSYYLTRDREGGPQIAGRPFF